MKVQDEMNVNPEGTGEKPKIFGMIMNPSDQFARIREWPSIWLPLLIVTVLSVIGSIMMASGIDFMDQPGMEGIPAEELALIESISKITFIVVGIFTPAIGILISTVIYVAVAKIARADVGFKQLFSMNIFIYLIAALSLLVNGLAFMVVGNANEDVLFTSINSILGVEGPIGAFLNMVEVFSIWSLIITAIGLQIAGKFSKKLAWGVVIAVYAVTVGFMMIFAGLSTMLGV